MCALAVPVHTVGEPAWPSPPGRVRPGSIHPLAGGRIEALPAEQRRLARALLEQPEVFAFGSIAQVERKFDVTSTTILRLAQALGHSGYQALQAAERERYLDGHGLRGGADPPVGAGTVRRLEAIRARHQAGLDRLHGSIRPQELGRAASLVLSGRRRLVANDGHGAGLPAALLAEHLREARLPAIPMVLDEAALHGVRLGDVVVAIEVCEGWALAGAVAGAVARGAAAIAITSSEEGPLARAADLRLVAPAQRTEQGLSVLPATAMVELLVAEIAARRASDLDYVAAAELMRFRPSGKSSAG
jgi:DNA-binding MurR/RpiR family transcriptional regulator